MLAFRQQVLQAQQFLRQEQPLLVPALALILAQQAFGPQVSQQPSVLEPSQQAFLLRALPV
jgi:hypothetical protein